MKVIEVVKLSNFCEEELLVIEFDNEDELVKFDDWCYDYFDEVYYLINEVDKKVVIYSYVLDLYNKSK